MRARAASRCIQSTETLLLMLASNSCAITRSVGSPMTLPCTLIFGKRVVERITHRVLDWLMAVVDQ